MPSSVVLRVSAFRRLTDIGNTVDSHLPSYNRNTVPCELAARSDVGIVEPVLPAIRLALHVVRIHVAETAYALRHDLLLNICRAHECKGLHVVCVSVDDITVIR